MHQHRKRNEAGPAVTGRRGRGRIPVRRVGLLAAAVAPLAVVVAGSGAAGAAPAPYLSHFNSVTPLASTVPATVTKPLRSGQRALQHRCAWRGVTRW